jgi:tRNA dimethylallyltransferase
MVYYIPLTVMGANRLKIISIVGPTCTGKSRLGLSLAHFVDGEIVNADSMQAYRQFNIGSAKPDPEELASVAHHLIDVVDPHEEFNAALFQTLADKAIEDISSRGKAPVVVGGTGLYQRVLLHGLFPAKSDGELRTRLRAQYHASPAEAYKELEVHDPQYAALVSLHDITRVVRGLEVFHLTGKTMSQWQKDHGFREERYDTLIIGLNTDRKTLYERINDRVEHMLSQGWIDEVKGLLGAGWNAGCKPFGSIGYKDILLFLESKIEYGKMVEAIKTSTRHYAKRQITWFSKERNVNWFEYPNEKEAIFEMARRHFT